MRKRHKDGWDGNGYKQFDKEGYTTVERADERWQIKILAIKKNK